MRDSHRRLCVLGREREQLGGVVEGERRDGGADVHELLQRLWLAARDDRGGLVQRDDARVRAGGHVAAVGGERDTCGAHARAVVPSVDAHAPPHVPHLHAAVPAAGSKQQRAVGRIGDALAAAEARGRLGGLQGGEEGAALLREEQERARLTEQRDGGAVRRRHYLAVARLLPARERRHHRRSAAVQVDAGPLAPSAAREGSRAVRGESGGGDLKLRQVDRLQQRVAGAVDAEQSKRLVEPRREGEPPIRVPGDAVDGGVGGGGGVEVDGPLHGQLLARDRVRTAEKRRGAAQKRFLRLGRELLDRPVRVLVTRRAACRLLWSPLLPLRPAPRRHLRPPCRRLRSRELRAKPRLVLLSS
mmetsp:Transcript_15238/g.45257  ORF Transcript_15238/g.45257 Transcript_15238/m.45257 type:complete len:359 (+) Transcript_15238:384-1460(+)